MENTSPFEGVGLVAVSESAERCADLADRAGETEWEIRQERSEVGLADAIVLATARERDARVLTGDPDFLVPALADEVIDLTAATR